MATTIELKNSVTTGNSPSTLAQGEMGVNITDKKVWIGNASSTPIQLIGAGASMSLTSLTTSSDASISGLTVGKGGGAVTANTALGLSALSGSNSGSGQNTAIGYQSMIANSTGSLNTSVGVLSLTTNTTGVFNTAIGAGAMQLNTTGGTSVAVGGQALYSNTTASNNTAVGYQAGYSNTTGTENVAIGVSSLNANTTGSDIVAIGYVALNKNTTGINSVAVGAGALQNNTTNSNNTALGFQAGYGATATGNTFIGYQAAQAGAGNYNVVIGHSTALNSTSDSFSILISGNSSATGKGGSTGFIQPGGGGVYQGNNSAAWSITSDQRLKKNIVDNKTGLDKITAIQVRNFEYRTKEEVTDLPSQNAIEITGVQLGAIAQELQSVLPDCVKTESTGVMSVDTTNLTWYLINAIKELNAKITVLENK